MATSMGIGQGAGTAAALVVRHEQSTRDVDAADVRALLLAQGQFLLTKHAEKLVDPALRLNKNNGSGGTASHHNPFAKG